LKAEIRDLTNEVAQLQHKLENRKDPPNESLLTDVRKQLEEQKAMYDGYKHAMGAKLNEATTKARVSASELDQLREELRAKEALYNEAKAKIEARFEDSQDDAKNKALKSEFADLQKEHDALKLTYEKEKSEWETMLIRRQEIQKKGEKKFEGLENVESSKIQAELSAALAANEMLQSKTKRLEGELKIAKDKLPNLERSLRQEVETLQAHYHVRHMQTDLDVMDEKCVQKLKDQRTLFEKIKSGIEGKLATAQKSLLEKEEELKKCKIKLASLQKEIEECRRISNDSNAADYYCKKLEEANKEIESLRVEVKKFRAVLEG